MYITTKTVKHNNMEYPVGADITGLSESEAKRLKELGAIKEKTSPVAKPAGKAATETPQSVFDGITEETELTEELLGKLTIPFLKLLSEKRGVDTEELKKKADIIDALLTPPV